MEWASSGWLINSHAADRCRARYGEAARPPVLPWLKPRWGGRARREVF
jgi:hypothetical protein